MTTIAIPDEVYQALMKLASEWRQTPNEVLAALIAQEQWEEHAMQAYDAYHAHADGPHEALTEEEFFQSLQESPTPAEGSADADV